jgi:hypothetical protein
MTEICARPGCTYPIDDSYVQLPEDRHEEDPPRFHSNDCAYEERFRRKYAARAAAD